MAGLVLLLLEMVVGTADEGVRVVELAVEIFTFLHVLNLDVHCETFGHELHLVAKPFDQYTGVALKLIKPPINCNKTLIDRIEASVEPLLLPFESLLKVLNKFLIHITPAWSRIG